MATIMSHNLPLIPLPLKASLAKTGLMMSGLLGKEVLYGSGPTERSSPVSEARSSPESVMMMAGGQPKEDDRMSCCSEDSELSVGQEVDLDGSDKTMNGDENRSVASSRIGGLDVEKLIDRHSVEVGEEVSNDSSRYSSSKEPSEEYMKIPVMRPSPTRLHEEFLRNSQLYAEELMRQQMQIVAAARGLNLSPKPLDPTLGLVTRLQDNRSPGKPMFTEEQKLGFRPHIRGVGDLYPDPNRWSDERSVRSPPESSSFRGIHSHLSAISQITQNLNSDISKLTSPSSLTSMTSRESSQSPPNNQLQAGNHAAHLLQLNNNIALNDQNLKFSIDNILKADFGRRITDPLKRSGKSYAKKPSAEKPATSAAPAAMDLTSVMTSAAGCSGTNSSGPSRSFNSSSSSASGSEVDVPASPQSSTGSSKTGEGTSGSTTTTSGSGGPMVWPAWVYCTRYSDRPSSGPRTRKPKKSPSEKAAASAVAAATAAAGAASASAAAIADDKRPRTAFSGPQLARLKHEFAENRYLTERRRQQLSAELGLNEAQIKIWFQNKRAKIKKSSGHKNPLALQLMAQGLYNHSTVPLTREEEELQEMQAAAAAAAESRMGSSD